MWPEVQIAKQENKRELKLIGEEISERLLKAIKTATSTNNNGQDGDETAGLDPEIFNLQQLNLLTINDTKLTKIPSAIAKLQQLQTILLFDNEITEISKEIKHLDKLKILDVSKNKLTKVPAKEIGILIENSNLVTINLSNNLLEQFNVVGTVDDDDDGGANADGEDANGNDENQQKSIQFKLSTINLSNNKLLSFPSIFDEQFTNLSEINFKGNQIPEIPFEISNLINLKLFNISSNQIKTIPKSLAAITKLKDLHLDDNPITDKRLLKLIKQCHTKQILDYVKQNGVDTPKSIANGTAGDKSNAAGNKSSSSSSSKRGGKTGGIQDTIQENHQIIVKHHQLETIQLIYMNSVRDVRPHILCCLVLNVNLKDGNNFKKFLQIQTKLHDTICEKREKSTIATHDLQKINGKTIRYTTGAPKRIEILPLGKTKKVIAQKLFDTLKGEAEALRKEKKRNVYSGIHKYLYLLENKDLYAYLEDGQGNVLSLPPLTNSDFSKISTETKDILIEITSSSSVNDCRLTMEGLLKEMLMAGFGNGIVESVGPPSSSSSSSNEPERNQTDVILNKLLVQQIKVVDIDGNLRTVYPSKTDLIYDENCHIIVERE